MTEAVESASARPRAWPLAVAARCDAGRAFQRCRPTFTGTFVFVAGFNLLNSAIEKVFEPNAGQYGPLAPWAYAVVGYALGVAIYISSSLNWH